MRSLSLSRAEVASSRSRMRGFFSRARAMALAAGELDAALPHHRVVAPGEAVDELLGVGGPRRFHHFFFGGVEAAVEQVLAHRAAEELGLLGHDADPAAQAGEGHVADVDAVDRHPSGLGLVETGHEVQERRLAGAARADDRQSSPVRRSVKKPRGRVWKCS
jgi:hypothetical protein